MEKKSYKEITAVILKAVTLAMGVAVAVLSWLGTVTAEAAVLMLEIGLACAGAAMMSQEQ